MSTAATMTGTTAPANARPAVAGKIGATLLCLYLLGIVIRIDGCYQPDARVRDEAPEVGPRVGDAFPPFALPDLDGNIVTPADLVGAAAVVAFVPSLDWSPPSKARVIELADAIAGRRDVRVLVVMTDAQATPRAFAFITDRRLRISYLDDGIGFAERLGLTMKAPDGSVAAAPATFVLDASGVVRLRDVRKDPRTWISAGTVLAAAGPHPGGPATPPQAVR